jgi:hypothetical protein
MSKKVIDYKTLYNEIIQLLSSPDYADLAEAQPKEHDLPLHKNVRFFQVKELTFGESKLADYIQYKSRAPGDQGVARLNQFFKDIYSTAYGQDPRSLIQWITQVIKGTEGRRFPNILAYQFRDFNFDTRSSTHSFTTEGDRAKQLQAAIDELHKAAQERVNQHEASLKSFGAQAADYLMLLLEQRAGVRRG